MMSSNKFTLKIVNGPANAQAFLFAQETVHIGSCYAQNDLIMNLHNISAQHARIWREKNKFFIKNLSDNQFTCGDGNSLAKKEIGEIPTGSEIDLGGVKLQLFNGTGKSSLVHKLSSRFSEKTGDGRLARYASLVKSKKKLAIGGLALGIVFVLLMVVNGLNKNKSGKNSTQPYPVASSEIPIALPAKGKYGYIKNNDRSHPDKAVFTFETSASNIELYYAPGGIDSEKEVSIHLNNQLVGYAPLAKGGWGEETVVRL
ncbi:MAG: FHA domain-containing protein, partial [Desulfobacteraceae bacterium]